MVTPSRKHSRQAILRRSRDWGGALTWLTNYNHRGGAWGGDKIRIFILGEGSSLLPRPPVVGSLKISRRNPCSPFFSVSYSVNRHKIL